MNIAYKLVVLSLFLIVAISNAQDTQILYDTIQQTEHFKITKEKNLLQKTKSN